MSVKRTTHIDFRFEKQETNCTSEDFMQKGGFLAHSPLSKVPRDEEKFKMVKILATLVI